MKSIKSKLTVPQIAVIGVMSAITCILGPLSIPIGVIPISFTNLAIYFALYVLGCKKGVISYLIYLFIGFVGVPVFSGFSSGPGKLFGPTGGYLTGFIFMAVISGVFLDKFKKEWYFQAAGLLLGTFVCYGFGSLWLSYQGKLSFMAAFAAGVLPFIPGDLIKIIIALIAGPKIRKQLIKANLFQ